MDGALFLWGLLSTQPPPPPPPPPPFQKVQAALSFTCPLRRTLSGILSPPHG